VPLESIAQDTNLCASAATNRRGCSKSSPG